jgi:hypothetical protein
MRTIWDCFVKARRKLTLSHNNSHITRKISRPRRTSNASRGARSHSPLLLPMPPRFRTKQTAKKTTRIKVPCKRILPSKEAADTAPKRPQMNNCVPPTVSVSPTVSVPPAGLSITLMNWLLSTYITQQRPKTLELNRPKVRVFLSFLWPELTLCSFVASVKMAARCSSATFALEQFVASALRCLKSTVRPSWAATSNLPVSHATSKRAWLLVHTSCMYSPSSCLWFSCPWMSSCVLRDLLVVASRYCHRS